MDGLKPGSADPNRQGKRRPGSFSTFTPNLYRCFHNAVARRHRHRIGRSRIAKSLSALGYSGLQKFANVLIQSRREPCVVARAGRAMTPRGVVWAQACIRHVTGLNDVVFGREI